ncbi:hypothetical protein TNIN_126931 [Trichonephila inaurata madagascariensis]|uniref:Chromo domain-containing protein n=1 Tax=Trichonephila inaurata madagascariensis TaxID=2747483 RepID=A0A8X7C2A1_9ARAC|nr:hypothetical protein TNIN_126931 [Trichonephila inaurata madagascariensis]
MALGTRQLCAPRYKTSDLRLEVREFVGSTSSEMLESASCEPNTVEFPSCETNIAEPANYGTNVTTSARTNITELENCRTVVAHSEVWIGGLSNYQNKKIKRMLKKSEALSSGPIRRSKRIQERRSKSTFRTEDYLNLKQKKSQQNRPKETEKSRKKPAKLIWKIVAKKSELPAARRPLPINEVISEREPEEVQGMFNKNNKTFLLVKWKNFETPEYIEKEKASEEIFQLLMDYLSPDRPTNFDSNPASMQITSASNLRQSRIKQEKVVEDTHKERKLENTSFYIKLE